ncbi:hypothetical protein ACFWPK_22275 [Nocardia sp. NPDC058519]|uniref:hypothetical protein n=1 Tax=Nocardia sp. NPDC058519 TaxID=3346535 RepID=UPI003646E8FF
MTILPEDVRALLAKLVADRDIEALRKDAKAWKGSGGLSKEFFSVIALQASELLAKYNRTEPEALAAIVAKCWADDEWLRLIHGRRGDDIGAGFVYIDEQDGETDHDTRRDAGHVIVRGPSGQHYAWTYFRSYLPEGLDPDPSWPAGGLPTITPVHSVEETETRVARVTRWLPEEPGS